MCPLQFSLLKCLLILIQYCFQNNSFYFTTVTMLLFSDRVSTANTLCPNWQQKPSETFVAQSGPQLNNGWETCRKKTLLLRTPRKFMSASVMPLCGAQPGEWRSLGLNTCFRKSIK